MALVRDPGRAPHLAELGVELVRDDLSDVGATTENLKGTDGLIHAAGSYRIGIPRSEHGRMWDANVGTTTRVLDAAEAAGVPRIVYVSTVNVFGNTGGEVVDESYERPKDGFLSYYDETKYEAHQVARDRIARGAPIVIVQPGGVYGPGDHSEIGNMIDQASSGKLFAYMFPETGFNLVHVDDVADGIILAYERGEVGQSYVLGGEIATMRGLVDKTAEIAGRKPPKRDLPVGVLKAVAPAGPVIGKIMGFPPNFKELISVSDGVTYWAKDDKARERLGYSPRDLDTGLRQTLAATGS